MVIIVLFAMACGGSSSSESVNATISGDISMTVRGVTSIKASGGNASSHANISVQAFMSGQELMSTTSDAKGQYTIALSNIASSTVVLHYKLDGYAMVYKTIMPSNGTDTVYNIVLAQLHSLECAGGNCRVEGNSLAIEGLPDGISGRGRVFNPVTEVESFPGEFNDDEGNLLLSGVFSSVELTDANGDAVENFDDDVTLTMQIPRDTWSIIQDLNPGNNQIDVPMYAFDKVQGTWVRHEKDGVLKTANKTIIPESDLAAIRDNNYTSSIYAVADVNHFSYWNVDWPVASHGCVSGTVVDADGNAIEGATVHVRGITYNGTSTPQTTDSSGHFCATVMRSEASGEDVDQDGITGEDQQVVVRVSYNGKLYDAGTAIAPTANASCGGSGCTDMGDIALIAANELVGTSCHITGYIYDSLGNPLKDASFFGMDPNLDAELRYSLCTNTESGSNECDFAATTDENGFFTLNTVILDSFHYYASYIRSESDTSRLMMWSEGSLQQCPTEAISIYLSQGYRMISVPINVSDNQISWDSTTYKASMVSVLSSATYEGKWIVTAADNVGMSSDITYGIPPANASQVMPTGSASPTALADGDSVMLMFYGTSDDGYTYWGSSYYVIGVGQSDMGFFQ